MMRTVDLRMKIPCTTANFFYILVQIILQIYVVSGTLVIKPKNAIAKVGGDNITMECKSNSSGVAWHGFAPDSNNRKDIYLDTDITPEFKRYITLQKENGSFNLLIKPSPAVALKYQCVDTSTGEEAFAWLTVLDLKPASSCPLETQVSSKTGKLEVEVMVNYSGHWIPTINWRVNGAPAPSDDLDDRSVKSNASVTQELNNVKEYDSIQISISLNATDKPEPPNALIASNVPTESYWFEECSPAQKTHPAVIVLAVVLGVACVVCLLLVAYIFHLHKNRKATRESPKENLPLNQNT